MGSRNAERQLHRRLTREPPNLVLSCGFAGALASHLTHGTVLFELEPEPRLIPLGEALASAGAVRGRFHCSSRVAVSADEKRQLQVQTGADAVEMESGVIREICRLRGIAAATVRVISDTAQENLPLDFNALMSPAQRIRFFALAAQLFRRPALIPDLLRFERQCGAAAANLATALTTALTNFQR
jgi:nucleoside phosphorylase